MSDALDTKSPWSSLSQPKSASQYYAKQMLEKPPEERQKYAEELAYNQLSFAPVSGEAISAKEAKDFYDEGRYGMMTLAGLGAIPLAGTALRPVTRSVGSLLNKAAQNTPTHIPEFYSNPIKGMFNFGKEYTKAVPSAIKESIDPQAVAKRRVEGISNRKIDDWASDKGQDADLTAISINRQLPNTKDTLLEKSIVGLKYLDSRIPREDTARLARGIGQGFRTTKDIPDSIVNRALNHLTKGPHIKNPRDKYEYQIKDPSAGGNVGYVEAIGVAKAGAPIVRAMRGKTTDDYLKILNTLGRRKGVAQKSKLEDTDMVEYMQIASTLDNKVLQLMQKMGAGEQPSVILETLLRARAKQNVGSTLQASEKRVFDSFNKLLDSKAIKMARVSDEAGNVVSARNIADIKKPEGYLVTQQSFTSRQQELGGMNAFVAVDPNKEKMYTMLSDGHDIFGVNPVGGHNLITATPIIESSYKTGSKYNNKQIKTKATKRNTNRALKETEQGTGVKKLKSETPEAYTKRAFRSSKPPVTEADRTRARLAKRKLQGTVVSGGLLTGAYLADDE
jgi:hypothetical protein